MCGICGYISQLESDQGELKKIFEKLLVASEVRGEDATGWAMVTEKKSTIYCKAPVKASKFVQQSVFKKFKPSSLVIGHTRQGTQGSPSQNANNHPIVTRDGLALVHNGIIFNDGEVKGKFNLKVDGEVDSEVLVRLVEEFRAKEGMEKAIKKALKELRGSAAAGLISPREPDTLYLVCADNPLSLAYHERLKTIFFASTSSILEKSLLQAKKVLGFFATYAQEEGVVINEVENNTLVVIQRKDNSFKISTKKVEMKEYVYSVRDYGIGEQTSLFGWEGTEDLRCPYCGTVFPDYDSLERHVQDHHPVVDSERSW